MARGQKKHLKRLNAPHSWMLGKMDGVWAPKPSCGPHKMRECLPMSIILRNRLKYALTGKEASMICMERHVKVDGKVRSDGNYPAGFMDVIELEASSDRFRLMYDTKGRFVLHRISQEETLYKLCRVQALNFTANKIPTLTTHDGRTVRFPDPAIKVNDTVKIDLATGKILSFIKFNVGITVMLTRGRNAGRVGTLSGIEKHLGSFHIVTIKDSLGNAFATRLGNCFGIGDGEHKELVSLPKGKGIKKGIMEERDDAKARGELLF